LAKAYIHITICKYETYQNQDNYCSKWMTKGRQSEDKGTAIGGQLLNQGNQDNQDNQVLSGFDKSIISNPLPNPTPKHNLIPTPNPTGKDRNKEDPNAIRILSEEEQEAQDIRQYNNMFKPQNFPCPHATQESIDAADKRQAERDAAHQKKIKDMVDKLRISCKEDKKCQI